MNILTDLEYQAALADLAEYERHIAESDRLAQRDSMRIAETLDRLYRDQRWVEERNRQRAETAKTSRGGAPIDPTSRSQFSTWVRDRFHRYQPRRVYQLLDAQSIAANYLHSVQVTPTVEAQVRPLRSLTSVANGSGARIPDVWELACKLAAEDGRDYPTEDDVRHGLAEWRRLNCAAMIYIADPPKPPAPKPAPKPTPPHPAPVGPAPRRPPNNRPPNRDIANLVLVAIGGLLLIAAGLFAFTWMAVAG